MMWKFIAAIPHVTLKVRMIVVHAGIDELSDVRRAVEAGRRVGGMLVPCSGSFCHGRAPVPARWRVVTSRGEAYARRCDVSNRVRSAPATYLSASG